ncbi:MAG: hypothetical protein DYH13_05825 [Alphaproteobacteria bacterium PRO2]|nr:hypothetical protein [Alphaproteobacteria bacterium PRO2]
MTDILAEIDAAMRQERMEKFWKENGKTLIFFVIATIVMTGVISGYRTWDANVKARDTEQLLLLTESKDFPDNIKDAKLDLRPGLRGIALVNGAQTYLSQKKDAEALALYTRAADDNSIPGEIRGLAILMQARLSKNPDDEKMTKNLDSVARDNNSPWQYHARLEAAALAAQKEDYKLARDYLAGVMDQKKVPGPLYQKAMALDHVYALREQEKAGTAENGKEGS